MKHLWIIDNESSTAVFYRNYSQTNTDPDLVSGLLSALHNFSEVELKSHGIESINMGGLSWVYLEDKQFNLLFIAADDKGTSPNVMRSRLEVIKNAFYSEFDLTAKKWKEIWHGRVVDFEKFKETSDIYNEQWMQAEKIATTAELFDMLGIFQQIFNLYLNILKLNFFGESYKDIIDKIQLSLKNVKELDQFKQDAEIKKIEFDEKQGWTVISINPAVANPDNLQKVLLNITRTIKDLITLKLGPMLAIHSFTTEIFPFILGNWVLIKKLNLDKKLLSIFLIN